MSRSRVPGPRGPSGTGTPGPTGPTGPAGAGVGLGTLQLGDLGTFPASVTGVLSPPDSGTFAYAGDASLALGANALLTYTGSTRVALVVLSAVMQDENDGTIVPALGVSLDGDQQAGDESPSLGTVTVTSQTDGDRLEVVCQRRVVLTNGATLQPIGVNFGEGGTRVTLVRSLSMSVLLVGA